MRYKNGVYIPPFDDTPTNAETEKGTTSDYAYDHAADTSTHGVSGAIVGTTDTQSLSNKTLTAPVINGTVTGTSLVLPAFTTGGLVTLGADINAVNYKMYNTLGIVGRSAVALKIQGFSGTHSPTSILFETGDEQAASVLISRLTIGANLATVVATWNAITHTGLKLGGALTLNGQVFDAGSGDAKINTTGALKGLQVVSSQDGITGVQVEGYVISANPANSDLLCSLAARGKTSTGANIQYGYFGILIEDKTNDAVYGKMKWVLRLNNAENDAMTLSSAGALWLDAGLEVGGNIVMATNAITGMADPSDPQDAATKQYVDDNIGGATIATGTYSGNDSDDRQITTGFKCSMVILMNESSALASWMAMPDGTVRQAGVNTAHVTDLLLHGTDGFVVDQANANESGYDPYNYWAISE